MSDRQRILVLTGPTATGKTALGVRLAQAMNGEVVSADSMQLYRGMDIGTAKPTVQEMQGIAHHLIDSLDPWQSYSVALYRQDAGEAIRQIAARGKLPIVVGGTGLYIHSLLYDMRFTSAASDPAVRKKWEDFAAANGPEALHRELAQRDPSSAARLHWNNQRRVVRALEVYELTGTPMSSQADAQGGRAAGEYDAKVYGLTMERPALYARVEQRVDRMMEAGLLEETRRLLRAGLSPDSQSMQAIGYKELVLYLTERCSLSEAVELLKRNTRRYAKRQLTWFRAMPEILWHDVGVEGQEEIFAKIRGHFLGNDRI